jgi:alkylation response protein AidB-like acyl-CoA dehydrogenase
MIGRQLVGRHAIAAVEHAMELAGGAGFYRSAGLERRFRDIQAARYHRSRLVHRRNTQARWRLDCRWTGSSEPAKPSKRIPPR